jgi:cell division septum initiation protein DivIVA
MRLNMSLDFSGPVAAFRTRILGFDKEEVRVCLQNLMRDYDEARKEIDRLTAELKTFDLARRAAPQEMTVVQVERLLASAQRVAEDVRIDSENGAQQILREAQAEAAQLRTQAETDASALIRTASTRLQTLEVEIEQLVERRQAVHALLERAADRLNEIAQEMRETALAPAEGAAETSPDTRIAETV